MAMYWLGSSGPLLGGLGLGKWGPLPGSDLPWPSRAGSTRLFALAPSIFFALLLALFLLDLFVEPAEHGDGSYNDHRSQQPPETWLFLA